VVDSLIAVSMHEREFDAHGNFPYVVLIVVFHRRHASLRSATSRQLCISPSMLGEARQGAAV
jgi:hypothetical protein